LNVAPPSAAPPRNGVSSPPSAPAFYDPKTDLGPSIRSSLSKNRDFIKRLEEGEELQVAATPPTPSSDAAPPTGGIDPESVDADTPLLWKVGKDGEEDMPIYRGRPPPEMLQGYGDTVLPRPMPETTADPVAPPPPPAQPDASQSEQGGWFSRLSQRFNGGESPAEHSPSASAGADAGVSDKLHSSDAYDDIMVDRDVGRDEAIRRATASNRNLIAALDEGADSLDSLVEADLEAFKAQWKN